MAAVGRVPAAAQGLCAASRRQRRQSPQAYIVLTLATAVTVAVVILVTTFLVGLWPPPA